MRYMISYTAFVDASDPTSGHGAIVGGRRIKRVSLGIHEAKNGIEAIYGLLRLKGITEDELASAHHIGSNKRVVLAGITFEANKVVV